MICVIGAGPVGLACLKALLECEIPSRAVEAKRRFYTAIVDNLEALGIPRNCSLIQLHELPPGDIAIRGGRPMTDFPEMLDKAGP